MEGLHERCRDSRASTLHVGPTEQGATTATARACNTPRERPFSAHAGWRSSALAARWRAGADCASSARVCARSCCLRLPKCRNIGHPRSGGAQLLAQAPSPAPSPRVPLAARRASSEAVCRCAQRASAYGQHIQADHMLQCASRARGPMDSLPCARCGARGSRARAPAPPPCSAASAAAAADAAHASRRRAGAARETLRAPPSCRAEREHSARAREAASRRAITQREGMASHAFILRIVFNYIFSCRVVRTC